MTERRAELPNIRVARELRARMSDYAPGQRLPSVATWAEEFRVSRATVARAFRTLESEGLVTVVPNWGVFRAEHGQKPTEPGQH